MALKRNAALTRDDLREALDSHQISISQVAKATGIPRSYVSEFLSIGRQLKPDQLQKIREHLEAEGVEFDTAPARSSGDAPHPSLAIANICHFPVRPQRMDEARTVLDEIERNDERIAELLDKGTTRGGTFLGQGDYTRETESDIRELFALAGANYFLMRYLTGVSNPFEQAEPKDTIRSVVVETIKDSLEKAGINIAPPEPTPTAEENVV